MTSVAEKLEQLFHEKDIPVRREEIDESLVIYVVEFNLKPTHVLRLEVIVEKDTSSCDVQIGYRYVSLLREYNKRHELFEIINQLNEAQTGYYTLYLAQDGEVYMKKLVRSGLDVQPIYEMIIQGPAIIRHILPTLEKITGELNTHEIGL